MEVTDSKFLTVENLAVLLNGREILSDISFEAKRGEFITILGRSGAGKSTLLKAIAGHIFLNKGSVKADNREIIEPCSEINYMHQSYELLPWLSVYKNVALALKYDREVTEKERRGRTEKLLKSVGLFNYANYKPQRLSGGMKQRTALARALNANAQIILMDEPFNSLDAVTKEDIIEFVSHIHSSFEKLFIMVSHDIDDSIYLSDRILILADTPARIVKEFLVPFVRPRAEPARATVAFSQLRQDILKALDEL